MTDREPRVRELLVDLQTLVRNVRQATAPCVKEEGDLLWNTADYHAIDDLLERIRAALLASPPANYIGWLPSGAQISGSKRAIGEALAFVWAVEPGTEEGCTGQTWRDRCERSEARRFALEAGESPSRKEDEPDGRAQRDASGAQDARPELPLVPVAPPASEASPPAPTNDECLRCGATWPENQPNCPKCGVSESAQAWTVGEDDIRKSTAPTAANESERPHLSKSSPCAHCRTCLDTSMGYCCWCGTSLRVPAARPTRPDLTAEDLYAANTAFFAQNSTETQTEFTVKFLNARLRARSSEGA